MMRRWVFVVLLVNISRVALNWFVSPFLKVSLLLLLSGCEDWGLMIFPETKWLQSDFKLLQYSPNAIKKLGWETLKGFDVAQDDEF